MRILIIEDEKPAFNLLLKKIKDHFPEAQIFGNLDSIKSAVDWFQQNTSPDLIFCDIQLADGISFEIFKKVKLSTPIIFTTAFDQYAIQAFQVNAVDYLLKPIDPDDLTRAIEKFNSNQLKSSIDLKLIKSLLEPKTIAYKTRFLVKFGEKIQSILVEEISFFYSEQRVTFLQTFEGKKFVLDSILEQVESQVDPKQFFRINRKYLCSYPSISDIFTYSNSRLKIKLHNCGDTDILISREKVTEFKNWLDG
ncbi:response regulator transcription factor [Algoriphagus aestuarii]|nr:response regulator transcription factor [Algoriphagus aestuarii]